MISTPRLLTLGLVLSAPAWAAQTIAPEALPADRYEKMIENSPFGVATPPPVVVDEGPSIFSNLYVSGVAKMVDASGASIDWVTVKSRADQSTFSLIGSEPNRDNGISIASVEWSERLGKSKVTVKKDGVFKTLEFDLANFQSGAPPAPGAPPNPQGNFPGQPPPNMPPPNNKFKNKGGGRIQPPIPRPNSVPQPPTAMKPRGWNPAPGAGEGGAPPPDRGRRRVINSAPQ